MPASAPWKERREAFYALFARDAIPDIMLHADAESPSVGLGGSKLGGQPHLPLGTAWPQPEDDAILRLLHLAD